MVGVYKTLSNGYGLLNPW